MTGREEEEGGDMPWVDRLWAFPRGEDGSGRGRMGWEADGRRSLDVFFFVDAASREGGSDGTDGRRTRVDAEWAAASTSKQSVQWGGCTKDALT